MKPGDIIKVKLGHDVHEAEVIRENPKTVLVKVLWSKTKHRKVKPDPTAALGQMNLFDGLPGFGTKSVKVPYIARGTKIIKIPKAKIVIETPSTIGACTALIEPTTPTIPEQGGMISRTTEAMIKSTKPEPSPTPAPQETVDEEVLAPEPEYEGPGLGKDEAPLIDLEDADLSGLERQAKAEAKPDPFADLEAAIKKKGGN